MSDGTAKNVQIVWSMEPWTLEHKVRGLQREANHGRLGMSPGALPLRPDSFGMHSSQLFLCFVEKTFCYYKVLTYTIKHTRWLQRTVVIEIWLISGHLKINSGYYTAQMWSNFKNCRSYVTEINTQMLLTRYLVKYWEEKLSKVWKKVSIFCQHWTRISICIQNISISSRRI